MKSTDNNGKVKFTLELEINEAVMAIIKANIGHIMDVASHMGSRSGGKGKMGCHSWMDLMQQK